MTEPVMTAADAISRAINDGETMRGLARKWAGSRDYRAVENKRSQLSKIVREGITPMDKNAAELEKILQLPPGTIIRHEPTRPTRDELAVRVDRLEAAVEALAALVGAGDVGLGRKSD